MNLNICIVGHTNVGKTSMMRTLSRSYKFGQVSFKSGTTRHVEKVILNFETINIELFDTPGLEDAQNLLDYIDEITNHKRIDGASKLNKFLETYASSSVFNQESKVLRQLMSSHAGVYVIDVREPVLNKYKDELMLLNFCAKPLLPVLNFINTKDNNEVAWRDSLAALGLHLIVRLDAHKPEKGELLLYESLKLLLPDYSVNIELVLAEIIRYKAKMKVSAYKLLSKMLIDITAFKVVLHAEADRDECLFKLRNQIRTREDSFIDELLNLYDFPVNRELGGNISFFGGRFADDLFNIETMKLFGIKAVSGAAAGAAFGAGIDLLTGGLTLGTAAALGAILGGTLQTIRHFGASIKHKITGFATLTATDEIILLLIMRGQYLINELEKRGHANSSFSSNTLASHQDTQPNLPKSLIAVRSHPNASKLNKDFDINIQEAFINKLMLDMGWS